MNKKSFSFMGAGLVGISILMASLTFSVMAGECLISKDYVEKQK